ncbi:heavy-metal-associated domain-containing protein [Flavobacterium suzhouense]|uniref:Heavy-metal-associated domain-containing protein n=1 Tax=Flavobacterium suzhouense TaxID=1529638 RepID=A0ABW5NV92_9FLAO
MRNITAKLIVLSIITLMPFAPAYSQIRKAEIIATGLTCSMCSNAINKQLKSIDGVEKVDTDLNTNTFTVFFKENAAITPANLKSSVEKAGFFIGSMVITLQLENVVAKDNSGLQEGGANYIFIDSREKALNGETRLKIQDKGYVTQKEYKKLQKSYSKYPTYNLDNEEDFHIKVI